MCLPTATQLGCVLVGPEDQHVIGEAGGLRWQDGVSGVAVRLQECVKLAVVAVRAEHAGYTGPILVA